VNHDPDPHIQHVFIEYPSATQPAFLQEEALSMEKQFVGREN
jgi:hypothetical protein